MENVLSGNLRAMAAPRPSLPAPAVHVEYSNHKRVDITHHTAESINSHTGEKLLHQTALKTFV